MQPAPKNWPRFSSALMYQDAAATQNIMFYVDDVDAHYARARSRGARIVEELATHDYGSDYWADRSYGALDPEGHLWWIAQRLRNPPN
jgi:uncharacterized glyoxalase superfamily protein PhnB